MQTNTPRAKNRGQDGGGHASNVLGSFQEPMKKTCACSNQHVSNTSTETRMLLESRKWVGSTSN